MDNKTSDKSVDYMIGSRFGKLTVIKRVDDYKSPSGGYHKKYLYWAKTNGYKYSLTIDRINNDEGYNPSNCRWVDIIDQANNKRNNHLIEFDGKTMTIGQWARFMNIPYKTLHRRINTLGWKADKALTQPLRKSKSNHNLPNINDCEK